MHKPHFARLEHLCAHAGVHFELRELVMALARRAQLACAILSGHTTRAELAAELGVSERTITSYRSRLEALQLPWLIIATHRRGWRVLINLDEHQGTVSEHQGAVPKHASSSSHKEHKQILPGSRVEVAWKQGGSSLEAGWKQPGSRLATRPSRIRAITAPTRAPATLAPTLYESSRVGQPRACTREPEREAACLPALPPQGDVSSKPVGATAGAEGDFGAWLAQKLADEGPLLVRPGQSKKTQRTLCPDAIAHAAKLILKRTGGDQAVACTLIEQRLWSQLVRDKSQRATTLAIALRWLVADAQDAHHLEAARVASLSAIAAQSAQGPRPRQSPHPVVGNGRTSRRFRAPTYPDAWDYSAPGGPVRLVACATSACLSPAQASASTAPKLKPRARRGFKAHASSSSLLRLQAVSAVDCAASLTPPAAQPVGFVQDEPQAAQLEQQACSLIASWPEQDVRAELKLQLSVPPKRRDQALFWACLQKLQLAPDALDDPWPLEHQAR